MDALTGSEFMPSFINLRVYFLLYFSIIIFFLHSGLEHQRLS